MTEKKNESEKKSDAERIEAIKREEREDASAYYEQGSSESYSAEEAHSSAPIEPVDKEQEEMGFLKTIAIVGLGAAGLALIFNFYFISDLETRVSGLDTSLSETDKKVDESVAKLDADVKTVGEGLEKTTASVSELDGKVDSFKKEIDENLEKANESISKLENAIGDYERKMAIMELKRALVAIKGVTANAGPDVLSSSNSVVSNIESLLKKLEGSSASGHQEAAEESEGDEEAEAEDHGEEVEESEGHEEAEAEDHGEEAEESEGHEEAAAEDHAEESEGHEEAAAEDHGEEAAEESESHEEAAAEDHGGEAQAHSAEGVESDVIPALAPADSDSAASHVGEIRLAASDHNEGEEIEEELPSVEELKSGH